MNPTIHNESALFPEIILVITYPINGIRHYVVTFEKDLAHAWPESFSEVVIKIPRSIDIKHCNTKTRLTPSSNLLKDLLPNMHNMIILPSLRKSY